MGMELRANLEICLPLPGFVWVAPICSGVNMVKT